MDIITHPVAAVIAAGARDCRGCPGVSRAEAVCLGGPPVQGYATCTVSADVLLGGTDWLLLSENKEPVRERKLKKALTVRE